jgi:cell division inhibitor SepF
VGVTRRNYFKIYIFREIYGGISEMGEAIKGLWHRVTSRDNYNEYETAPEDYGKDGELALDNNRYEGEYSNAKVDTLSSEKVMRFTEKSRHNLRFYKLEGHNWQQVAKLAAEELKNGSSIVINTESANKDAVGRMADFMGGVAFAIDGRLIRIGNSSWAFVPENTELGGDIYDESNYPFEGMFGQ